MKKFHLSLAALLLTGCLGYPETVKPVQNFQLERYLGTWHEIARLDHSFERGLEKVTANYTLRDDGGVRVKNRGFSTQNNEWQEAEGKAFFVRESDEGYLKVSFFGPFYASYVIFGLDQENYQYAFISGPKDNYLWFLSRTPTVSDTLMTTFVTEAKKMGFPTDELIYVNQK